MLLSYKVIIVLFKAKCMDTVAQTIVRVKTHFFFFLFAWGMDN